MASSDQNWLRRFRSSSFSSDFEIEIDSVFELQRCREHSALERSHSSGVTSSSCRLPADDYTAALAAGQKELKEEPNCFPFACLTRDCKLYVFACLNPCERGVASQVCSAWASLMSTATLWSIIDLVAFPPCSSGTDDNDDVFSTEDNVKVYEAYRARMKRFVAYLVSIGPAIRTLRFQLDIGDVRDGWLEMLHALFRASQLNNLHHAELGWTDTPCKPYIPDSSSATWCANDCKDLMYRHRHRQRLFVKFFDLFTAIAVNVVSLSLPFDWTERSIHALHRLSKLRILNLQKYFIFQPIDQAMIDCLFTSAPMLSHVTMEIWTPSGRGLQAFRLVSTTVKYLNVSQCRGFYIESVDLPELAEFHVSLCPMNGPLVSGEGIDVMCVLDVLRTGAPNLQQLNEHILCTEWRSASYSELDTLLKLVCGCKKHQHE